MKRITDLNNMLIAVLFIALFSAASAYFGNFALWKCVAFFTGLSVALSFVPRERRGVLQSGIYREVWTGEVLNFVTAAIKNSFLTGIQDYSQYVTVVDEEMQVIHLASMNVLPDVLINNTTYPIEVQDLGITDIPIALAKFDTKVTPITKDEMYASSVKKMALVKDRHGKAIMIVFLKKALHALAPASDTANMPVLLTTGASDGTGRKRLLMADLLKLKGAADDMGIDESARRLVLCTDHVNDLIYADPKLEAFFYNRTSGVIQNLLGFNIDSHVSAPYYDVLTKTKLSFGAVPDPADHQKASVFFSTDRAARALGSVDISLSEAKTDPLNKRNLVSFRQYGIVLPTAEEHRGAIVSGL